MPETIRILVVEDDLDMYETYEDTAADLSTDDYSIILERKTNETDAKIALLSNSFDGAIVDLNLNAADLTEVAGNHVLREIIERHRFPVLVVSGNLRNLEDDIFEKKSDFLSFFDRETTNTVIFEQIIRIYKTGITKILGGRGLIEKQLTEIFWMHLAKEFNSWQNANREKILLRYTLNHFAEYLDIPNNEDRFYHEAEFYIKPPIRKFIATGDIVQKDGKRFIILSPSCDIAVRNVENGDPIINSDRIIIAPIIKIDRESFLINKIIKVDTSRKDIENNLKKFVKGQHERYVFLPEHQTMYPALVDLREIYTWSKAEYLQAERIATVSALFIKDIQAKFASYLGRQGQPDLNKDEHIDRYKSRLFPV